MREPVAEPVPCADVYVLRGSFDHMQVAYAAAILHEKQPAALLILLSATQSLEGIDPEQMRRAGWVRASEEEPSS